VQIFFAIFFLLIKSCGTSQSKNPADIVSFTKSTMGKPVSSSKGLLKCATASNNNGNTIDSADCRNFYFYPGDKNIRIISTIEFPALILDTDSLKLVNSISWFKSYREKDSSTSKRRFKMDNNNIKQYFKTLFHAEGTEDTGYKDEYYTNTVTKWLFDSFNVIVDVSTYFKRGKQDEFSVLAIYIVKKQP